MNVRVVSSCAWLLALALASRAGAFAQPVSTQDQPQQAGSASNAKGQGQPNQSANAGNPDGQDQPNQAPNANKPQGQSQGKQLSNASYGPGQSQSDGAANKNNSRSRSGNVPNLRWHADSNSPSSAADWRYTWMYTGQMPDQPNGVLFGWVDQASRNSGMTLAPADAALRAHLKLPEDEGLIVTAVEPGSPAAAVGIHQNDVLLRLAGDSGLSFPTGKSEDLESALKAFGESPITIALLRGGRTMTVKVQPKIHASLGPVRPEPLAYWIGVTVAPVDPALRSQLQLPEKQGLLVTEVDKFGPAARAGVRPFDILRKFDGADIVDQAALTKLVQSRADKVVVLELLREGKPQEIKVVPQRRHARASTLDVNPGHNDGGVWDLVFTDPVGAQTYVNPPYINNLPYFNNQTYVDSPYVNWSAAPTQGLWLPNVGDPSRSGGAILASPPAAADGNASADKKIDELSKQIHELRQAIEALAKSQAKK